MKVDREETTQMKLEKDLLRVLLATIIIFGMFANSAAADTVYATLERMTETSQYSPPQS